ncbi:MAG TPA: hypothetical protein VHV82_20355 [Sporichthyaceae bacterium]|jgi:hypothetical protein|nr:hypothetical protein [Sporichthyaceae bacterium]
MRKFVATAAVAASAAATVALTPLAAHASFGPNSGNSEIRTGCQNGVTGWYTPPSGHAVAFELVPGTSFPVEQDRGIWSFTINKPDSLEAYGPALGSDKSAPWATQRVEKAIVNLDGGAEHIFFNDTANSFSFNVPTGNEIFSVYYQCGIGKG